MEHIRDIVRDSYGKIARNKSACCGPAAGCCGVPGNKSKTVGYSDEELGSVPDDSNLGLGCGNPTAIAGLKHGEIVVDLGSGGGLDCLLAVKKVGHTGRSSVWI